MLIVKKSPIAAAILAAASLGLSAAATAQTAPAPEAKADAAASTTATASVSDEQVRQYALALVEVSKLQKQYEPQILAASETEKPVIAKEVNAQMAAAVKAQGLDAKTFNSIGASAQQDAALSQKIQAEVQKAQPSQQPSQ